MHASDVSRIIAAVADKRLPIRPGDLIIFKTSAYRLLVVACLDQDINPNTGQQVWGLISAYKQTTWWNERIDWKGFNTLWTIHRPS